MVLRPVAPRARRSALMAASVPELTSRTCSTDGTCAAIASASSISRYVGAPNERPSAAAARTCDEVRASTADDEAGRAADGAEGPHRRVHAARDDALGALEQAGVDA